MSLLGTLTGGLGTAFGAYMQSRADKKNREFQREQNQADTQYGWDMYNRQRRDATDDWNSMNAYNSPEEQMNRLRQAGLNPNLVYGKGADNTAAMVRSSQGGSQHQTAPRMDSSWALGILGTFLNLQQTQAQTDNLHEQRNLMIADKLMKGAQTRGLNIAADRGQYDLDLQRDLRDNVITKSRLENEKLSADIAFTLDSNERARLSNTVNVEKTVQEILTEKLHQKEAELRMSKVPLERQKLSAEIAQLKQITANAAIEGEIKKLDLKLYTDFGLRPSDPYYWRALLKALGSESTVVLDSGEGNYEVPWLEAFQMMLGH